MANTITAANAVFMLSVAGVFSSPQQIQGFSMEDVFDTEPIEPTEVQMGVDGNMSAGFVFVPTKQGITLQADSASNSLFEQWRSAQVSLGDVVFGNATVLLTSISRKYTLTKGVITSYPQFSDAKKVLMPRKFGLTWQSVSPAPV